MITKYAYCANVVQLKIALKWHSVQVYFFTIVNRPNGKNIRTSKTLCGQCSSQVIFKVLTFFILPSSQDTIYKDQAKKIICQNIQRNRNDRNRTFRNV